MRTNVILGGGFTGLFSALVLSEKFNLKDIIVIEASPYVCGAYRGIKFDENQNFDYGPHL